MPHTRLGLETLDAQGLLNATPTPVGPSGRPTDRLDVRARLNELRRLSSGWLDGKGLSLNAVGLDRLTILFDAYYQSDLPPPHLYPTAEGGVRAEWAVAGWEVSLDIALDTLRADWHALKLATDAETVRTLNLTNADDWHRMRSELLRMVIAAV